MIMVIGLVVVLAVLAATGVLGAGVFGGGGRKPGPGLLAALSVPVVAALGVVVLAAFAFVVVGVGGDDGGGDKSAAARPTPSTTAPVASSRITAGATSLPGVVLEADEDGRFANYLPIGGLTPGAVIRVRAQGFDSFERGKVAQCVTELGRLRSCGDAFPVQFDEDGRADFQLTVTNQFAPGGCRRGQPACSLRLAGNDSRREATQQTVFVDDFAAGGVTVTPARGLAEGQTVNVAATGLPAGASASVVLCAPPGRYDVERCSSPTAESSFVADARGDGRTSLAVASGRSLCGAGRACAVVVVVGNGYVSAAAAPIGFSRGPGVAYRADRVVPGVVIALVLIVIALVLGAKTDWTKPAEAATPALDAADLRTDQNLDDLFGADEELDERDPIPW